MVHLFSPIFSNVLIVGVFILSVDAKVFTSTVVKIVLKLRWLEGGLLNGVVTCHIPAPAELAKLDAANPSVRL